MRTNVKKTRSNRAWVRCGVVSVRMDEDLVKRAAMRLHPSRGWTRLGSAIRQLIQNIVGHEHSGRPTRKDDMQTPNEITVKLTEIKVRKGSLLLRK